MVGFFRPGFLALMMAGLASLAVMPAYAQNAACPQPAQPAILQVELGISEPKVDHTLSRRDLKRFDIAVASPYAGLPEHNVHVNGLMRGAITLETTSTLAWQRTRRDDSNCFWYNKAHVMIKLYPTIYLAKEIPESSCLYREVLNHERQHFAVDSQIAREYQATIRNELSRFLQQSTAIGPYASSQNQQAQDFLKKRFEQALAPIYEQLKVERIKRQAAVDTREEYERVAHLCPSERGLM